MEKEIQKLINEYKNKLLKNRTDNENELSMYKAIHRETIMVQLEKTIKDLENILKESKTITKK